MCYAGIASSIICLFVNTYYTGKLIQVSFLTQMKDLSGSLILSVLMFVLVSLTTSFGATVVLQLVYGVLAGGVFYFGLTQIFKFSEIDFIRSIIVRR